MNETLRPIPGVPDRIGGAVVYPGERPILTVRDFSTPRRWAKMMAAIRGFFWLPCPVCHEMFAGFESGPVSVPTATAGERRIACLRHEWGNVPATIGGKAPESGVPGP